MCRPLLTDFCHAATQEATLVFAARKLERTLVLQARLLCPAYAAEQVSARRVEVLVAVQVELIDEGETRLGAVRVCNRDRPVQLDDGGAGQERELAVQRRDLRPVARLLGMQRRDGC